MTESPDPPAAAKASYWAEMFGAHYRAMLLAATQRLGRDRTHLGHSAQSVVQDVIRHMIERGELIDAANPEAYLVAAVTNRAKDILRQERRRDRDHLATQDDLDKGSWDMPTQEDVARAATDAAIRDQTEEILKTMNGPLRSAFTERVQKGRPYTEIARDMGISDSQVRRLHLQAVGEIRRRLRLDPDETR